MYKRNKKYSIMKEAFPNKTNSKYESSTNSHHHSKIKNEIEINMFPKDSLENSFAEQNIHNSIEVKF
jgi:hypothetical protein